ncbi:glycosyltransferase family 2 protein [Candidatus Omnitrophota bacterium]
MKDSLTIFFPCYNDSATIAGMVVAADMVARQLTEDYEILVVDDGSSDHSREVLKELSLKYNRLRLVFHDTNMGYGGALKSGFKNATKELIFYTDGDAQYDVHELKTLWQRMSDDVDVVNGFKMKRHDPWHRVFIGFIYQHLIRMAFALKIKDVDCDCRLMRSRIFDKVKLQHDSGVICVEMIRKIQEAGFRFTEVGVHHFFRAVGKSQFFNFKRLARAVKDLAALWVNLIILTRGVSGGDRFA